jgi:hypothetical protein
MSVTASIKHANHREPHVDTCFSCIAPSLRSIPVTGREASRGKAVEASMQRSRARNKARIEAFDDSR